MTPRQIQIGDKFLKFFYEKGEANVDEYHYHLTEECGFRDLSDQGQIGMVKAHLIKLGLITPMGIGDYFFTLTSDGMNASEIGIEKWLKREKEEKPNISASNVVIVNGGMTNSNIEQSSSHKKQNESTTGSRTIKKIIIGVVVTIIGGVILWFIQKQFI
jgi:hypothetical protein